MSETNLAGLPDDHQETQCLLPKLTPHDSVQAFLYTFEQTTHYEGWPEEKWLQLVASLLIKKAKLAFYCIWRRN